MHWNTICPNCTCALGGNEILNAFNLSETLLSIAGKSDEIRVLRNPIYLFAQFQQTVISKPRVLSISTVYGCGDLQKVHVGSELTMRCVRFGNPFTISTCDLTHLTQGKKQKNKSVRALVNVHIAQ